MIKYIEKIILEVDDYIQLFGSPKNEGSMTIEDKDVLARFISQATAQFDSLVSSYGKVGYLFEWWDRLTDTIEDNRKGLRLQKAIGSWVETMILSGKFWVDNLPNMQSNIQYSISSSSNDASIENKRKDIIQDLVAIGLTQTSNVGDDDAINLNGCENIDDYIIITKSYLNDNYLQLDSSAQRGILSSLNFNDNSLYNCGNIESGSPFINRISRYRLVDCIFENASCDKILDRSDMIYKYIDQFPISTWDGLTREQIYDLMWASGTTFRNDLIYKKDWIVTDINDQLELFWFRSKIDNNIGNNPFTSPDAWEKLKTQPLDVQGIIDQLKPYIISEVKTEVTTQINALPTIEYTSEYPNEVIEFETQQDYEAYKLASGTTDTDFQDIIEPVVEDLNITSTETYAGYKWNGKNVYAICFQNLPKGFTPLTNAETIVDFRAFRKETGSATWYCNDTAYSSQGIQELSITKDAGGWRVYTNSTSGQNYITIWYTKIGE